jgi:transcriptional regulator with XRE-family HTH domain
LLKEFGKRVLKRRIELDLTQEAVAEKAGLHSSYIFQIESGIRNVSLENLARVARGIDMDLGDLLKGLQRLKGRK